MEEKQGKVIAVNIENQMKSAYIDYSMSVIVSRALPDAVSYTHLTLPTIYSV
mgnify:CR=1 FL=1